MNLSDWVETLTDSVSFLTTFIALALDSDISMLSFTRFTISIAFPLKDWIETDSLSLFTMLKFLNEPVETLTDSLSLFTIPRPFIVEAEISNVSLMCLTTLLAVPLNT